LSAQIRDSGPTEHAIAEVRRAWPIDDEFKIAYLATELIRQLLAETLVP